MFFNNTYFITKIYKIICFTILIYYFALQNTFKIRNLSKAQGTFLILKFHD